MSGITNGDEPSPILHWDPKISTIGPETIHLPLYLRFSIFLQIVTFREFCDEI
jgi:hypothetical protein